MLIERFVLYGYKSIFEVVRHFTYRYYGPVLGVMQCIDLRAVYIIENGRTLDVGIQAFLIYLSDLYGRYEDRNKDHQNSKRDQPSEDRQYLASQRFIRSFFPLFR